MFVSPRLDHPPSLFFFLFFGVVTGTLFAGICTWTIVDSKNQEEIRPH